MSEDGREISLSIEETNKLRASLGLPLLQTQDQQQEKERNQLKNYEKLQKENDKKEKRKLLAEQIKQEKIIASSSTSTKSTVKKATKGLGQGGKEDLDDTMAWATSLAKNQEKRAKTVQKALKSSSEKVAQEYNQDHLEGLKVAHRLDDLNQDTVLVLKDALINEDDQEGDQLMNVNLADLDQARKDILLKKGPKKHDAYEEFERSQMGLEKKILSYYDDPTLDQDDTGFVLGRKGTVNVEKEMQERQERKILGGAIPQGGVKLDYDKTREMADFYTQDEILAFKKPKKKKKKASSRKKEEEDEQDNDANEMDIDEQTHVQHASFSNSNKTTNISTTNFVDDDELQAMLSKQRQKANTSVNIALRVLQQVAEEEKQEKRDLEQHLDGGLVISELSEFVGTLTGKSVLDEQVSEPKVRVPSMPSIQDNNSPLEMDVDQDQSLQHVQQGVEEEEGQVSEADQEADVFSAPGVGLAATLKLLKATGDIKPMTSEEKQRDQIERERLKFLEEQRRKDRLLELEEEREKEARRNGKRVRQDDWEYQRQQKEMERDRANQISKLYESYKPNFDLTYRDATGRELSTKEAFNELAQKFHGKKSGKKKTEKKLEKLQQALAVKKASATDTPLNSVALFSDRAKSTGSAFLSLSKGASSNAVDVIDRDVSTTNKSGERKVKPAAKASESSKQAPAAAPPPKQQHQFTIVQPEPLPTTTTTQASATAATASRPKIAFGLSMKKGLKK